MNTEESYQEGNQEQQEFSGEEADRPAAQMVWSGGSGISLLRPELGNGGSVSHYLIELNKVLPTADEWRDSMSPEVRQAYDRAVAGE